MPGQKVENRLWYKDAVIYEVHVRSFYDSNGDGIGDFRGLRQKLPYLHDLGVTAIWLLPFYPSPLRDDGYDITDYFKVHPHYGNLGNFQELLRDAHRLGIRVITELVLNHTSDQHPWFQKARRAKPGSVWRNFYVWSDTPDKYQDARIIFKDFEPSNWSWDPVARAYYWHRFYSHQPDLNYDNPRVHEAMFRVIDFWLGMGVDGVRIDAVPYLYEREGTNCENLPETYEFLKKLRAFVDGKYPGRILLAEANQWPEDAASYFGKGDACHMAFHFPLMPRMFMALQMEDSFPITNILEQTPPIPEQCQWALFLRNHDELTLEMVTDEERDYMYRVYAKDPHTRINLGIRRRLAPLMENDRRKMELMYVLFLSLPGTPIIYYGDEIGMGDNYYLGDRNGVRTPMQWSLDRNAGFSLANPQKLYLPVIIDPEYRYETVNVENQTRNPSSLLWWLRRMIDLRKRFVAFRRGILEFIPMENPKILAFVRRCEEEVLLVLVNLSRFSQAVEINHPHFSGYQPEDIFSGNRFPVIKDTPYVVILGPHDYHLLLMEKTLEPVAPAEAGFPEIAVTGKWENVLAGAALKRLENTILPRYLKKCRWFGGKGRAISRLSIGDTMPFAVNGSKVVLAFIEIFYSVGDRETYLLPLHFLSLADAGRIQKEFPEAIIARLTVAAEEGIIYDGVCHAPFHTALLELIARRKEVNVKGRKLSGHPGQMFRRIMGESGPPFASQVAKMDQSNTAIHYNDTFFFKLYRRVEEGVNPEVEIGRFLTEKVHFAHIAPMAGVLEYRRPGAEPVTLGIIEGFIPNQGDAWTFTLHEVTQFADRVLAHKGELKETPQLLTPVFDIDPTLLPPSLTELLGGFYPEMAALLGTRTGELHLALSSRTDAPAFTPEPFSLLYQRSLYQSIEGRVRKVVKLLEKNLTKLSEKVRAEAETVMAQEKEILEQLREFLSKKFSAMKTRTHGDYHLGQVLYTGNDFVIIDFEGEPARAMSERRIKHSPLRDMAGMIHSFQCAALAVLLQQTSIRAGDIPFLEPWVDAWYRCIAGIFLQSYLKTIAGAPFMPKEREEARMMLSAFILDKAFYELGYELDNRPEWVTIPLRGILEMLKDSSVEANTPSV